VLDPLDPPLAALGFVVEPHDVAVERDASLLHRGDAIALVLLRVVLGADAEEASIQQARGTGEDASLAHLPAPQIPRDTPAQRRQGARELDHRVELLPVPALSPEVVVAVLLASRGVDAGRLDVPHRIGADPDVLPGRRNAQLRDPLEHRGLADLAAVLVEVLEPAPAPTARDSRSGAVHTPESGHSRGVS
jgi:hypothetical protein